MIGAITLLAGLTMGAAGATTIPVPPADPTDPTDSTLPNGPAAPGTPLPRCIVRLHGSSGRGQPTAVWGGIADVMPNGNRELTSGGLMWDYDTDDDYAAALAIVEEAVQPCDAIMLDGFSNGAAFAALLYCRGETFDGRLLRVVIDDPVTDASVTACAPDPSVDVALYWTGALADTSVPGTDCSGSESVCLGGTMIGIEAFAQELGVEPLVSIHTEHLWHWYAPELADWGGPSVATTPVTSGPHASAP